MALLRVPYSLSSLMDYGRGTQRHFLKSKTDSGTQFGIGSGQALNCRPAGSDAAVLSGRAACRFEGDRMPSVSNPITTASFIKRIVDPPFFLVLFDTETRIRLGTRVLVACRINYRGNEANPGRKSGGAGELGSGRKGERGSGSLGVWEYRRMGGADPQLPLCHSPALPFSHSPTLPFTHVFRSRTSKTNMEGGPDRTADSRSVP